MAIHVGYDSGEPKRVPAGNETDGTDQREREAQEFERLMAPDDSWVSNACFFGPHSDCEVAGFCKCICHSKDA